MKVCPSANVEVDLGRNLSFWGRVDGAGDGDDQSYIQNDSPVLAKTVHLQFSN